MAFLMIDHPDETVDEVGVMFDSGGAAWWDFCLLLDEM